jgi:chemotaxis protein MotB
MALPARMISLSAALALLVGAQGCVGLHTYDDQNRKIEALQTIAAGADTAIGNYKRQLSEKDAKIRGLEAHLGNTRQSLAAQQSVLAQERDSLEQQYQRMVDELRADGGMQFVINQQTGGIVLENDIFFSSGKAELRPEARTSLDGLIAKLGTSEFSDTDIEIAGHTDSDPITRSGWDDNYQLSAERARAVLLYFVERGIGAERVFLSGYGYTRPRSNEKSENRRVEVVLHRD